MLLPAMLGPVMSEDRPLAGPELRVVRHERPRRHQSVEHRMPARFDAREPARPRSRAGNTRCLTASSAERRQSTSTWASTSPAWISRGGLRGHRSAERDEEFVLQLAGPVLGAEDLFLVLLQLRRDVPLGVLERLLPRVVGRDLRGLGVGDLDVVPEDLVEPDFEVGDAGAADLAPPGSGRSMSLPPRAMSRSSSRSG